MNANELAPVILYDLDGGDLSAGIIFWADDGTEDGIGACGWYLTSRMSIDGGTWYLAPELFGRDGRGGYQVDLDFGVYPVSRGWMYRGEYEPPSRFDRLGVIVHADQPEPSHPDIDGAREAMAWRGEIIGRTLDHGAKP